MLSVACHRKRRVGRVLSAMAVIGALAGIAPRFAHAEEWHGGKGTEVVFPPLDARYFEQSFMQQNAPAAESDAPATTGDGNSKHVMEVSGKSAKASPGFKQLVKENSPPPGLRLRTGSSITMDDWDKGKRTIKGVAFDVLPGGAMASNQISLYGGAVSGASGYTSGVRWINRFNDSDILGADLAYNAASTDVNSTGEWLARLGGGMDMGSPLGGADWRLLGGFSAFSDVQSSGTDSSDSSGGFLSVSRPSPTTDHGVSYSFSARRYGNTFQPWEAEQIPNEQSLNTQVTYHFGSSMAMRLRSKFASDGFDSDNPLWVRQNSIGLVDIPLPWPGRDVIADVEALTRYEGDHVGDSASRSNGFDVRLRQALGFGWRSRLGVGVLWKRDLLHDDDALHRQFTFAGRHPLRIGRFDGTVGPGVAWRCNSGYDASSEFQAGLIMQWADYANIWSLNIAYLDHRNELDASSAVRSFQTMLSYRIAIGGNARSQLSGGWYQPSLIGF